jgi:cytoskeletal protein CcmA (bactofilin family)
MWKRDVVVKPTSGQPGASGASSQQDGEHAAQPESRRRTEREIVNVGKSLVFKGDLSGSEDLIIEGVVEGKIELRENILTIGPNGRIKAALFAKAIIVLGEVNGNVTALEKIDIREGASVDGDLVSPRVTIADGAHFRGSVDMQKAGRQPSQSTAQPASKPTQSGVRAPQGQTQTSATAR